MAKKPKSPKKRAPPKKPAKKTAKPSKLRGLEISVDEAGALLGVSGERVRQLVKEGYISKPARNSVALKSAVQGYIKFLTEDGRRGTKSAAATRVAEARAKQIEVRTAKEVGELVPKEEANALLQSAIGAFVAGLNSLPAQLTRDLDERRKIETAIDGVRAEVAKVIEEFGHDYGELDELDPADGESAAGPVGKGE